MSFMSLKMSLSLRFLFLKAMALRRLFAPALRSLRRLRWRPPQALRDLGGQLVLHDEALQRPKSVAKELFTAEAAKITSNDFLWRKTLKNH